ncbi:protein SUPPRESSOR OF NPR1-1 CONSTITUTIVE 4-like isoform X2 [Panicum virgatum]|nr:protein SUPPRESSOR OF NPR1-1 CONSTITUTIVE 4-like isoform X2 [Panicum virgatum]XP_039817378.1 protein SUPPRESSOR OF NPR1-1 CONSTITUTIVE 4-like isoform X2 [Panicum virgatum]
MAPEFYKGVITFKTDIYSLGVTITQILIGKKYYSATDNLEEQIGSIVGRHNTLGTRVCAEISEACINGDPAKRPDTWRIIKMLVETETDDRAVAVMDKDAAVFDKVNTVSMELDVPECIFEGSKKPGNLCYQLLRFITGNFSDEQIIGKTGFANIFKGTLGLRNVAVKSYRSIHIDDQKFHNEVIVMLLAQHKNIVKYLGYCSHTEIEVFEVEGKFVIDATRERVLCFEYLRNGSLDGYVSDASCGLEWRPRYQIIRGICEGLHYLHGERIVHLDLNPTSILLDDNMVPKLGDFYLSRFLGENESQTTATSSFGTRGYMAPEFLDTQVITFKSDIYSLGVTITEILIGHKHYSAIENVLECWKNRLLHMSSADMVLLEQVRVCAEISSACIGDDPDKRPDMRRIIEMLDEAENNVDALYVELDVIECILEGGKEPSILSHQILLFITGIFSREQEIGRSEYTITYRGILRQRSIAVKRLLMPIGFNEQMFQNQVKTMMLAQHKNIVQFLGYCSYNQQEAGEFDMADMRERLTCFEDLSNGSLDRYVLDASLGLEWSVRYQIIKGICEGLTLSSRKQDCSWRTQTYQYTAG